MKAYFRLALVVLVVALLSLACSQSVSPETPESPISPIEPPGLVKGFGISPQGFPATYEKYGDFLTEVGEFAGGGVFYNGAWRDDVVGGSDAGQIPQTAKTVAEQAATYHYTPIFVFGWRSHETITLAVPANPANNWSNQETRALFEGMLVEFAQTYHPPFLFLANENSFYYQLDPDDYMNFIAFYNHAYDAVKAVSPETKIGVVFNYEHLAGKGRFSQWNTPYWEALSAHDFTRLDVIGVTLYPFLNFATPEEIPDTYLDELTGRIGDIPIAITETGWPGTFDTDVELAWEASDRAQVVFADKLNSILSGKNVVMVNWLFLYPYHNTDANDLEWMTFGTVALCDDRGDKRPIFDVWSDFTLVK
jgi:hypothetical protein